MIVFSSHFFVNPYWDWRNFIYTYAYIYNVIPVDNHCICDLCITFPTHYSAHISRCFPQTAIRHARQPENTPRADSPAGRIILCTYYLFLPRLHHRAEVYVQCTHSASLHRSYRTGILFSCLRSYPSLPLRHKRWFSRSPLSHEIHGSNHSRFIFALVRPMAQ